MPADGQQRIPRLATKIAVILDEDLPTWQKLNVTAFLSSGIAATASDAIGERYEDADGNEYAPMFGQPVMVFGADKARLLRTLNRAMDRGVTPAIFTMDLFGTGDDDANRAAVGAVRRVELDIAGLAIRAERKVVDKVVDGLRLHR
ncbi:DUF2000 domain-containing protein [Mycobacterium yunnanensis]|uniref:DUF2000 domain-containing protein n=2 Tax=Mycobacterium yunnanensis TaxID=368477 RepID=A0A9X3BSU4_9MYCO|nr:DUF2000 domain-containing protein [Mycobacterium yunnanensis]